MREFYYVYILVSKDNPAKHYTGITTNLEERLKRHNSGAIDHTRKYGPWNFETVVAFTNEHKAVSFERYLKTHSGRSFAKRHF